MISGAYIKGVTEIAAEAEEESECIYIYLYDSKYFDSYFYIVISMYAFID